ncbi:MAG: fatty acid desaturase, partial [Bacteroidetes bacterium]|nr:fatty acid desaturase [Bacteroidota bacterium]
YNSLFGNWFYGGLNLHVIHHLAPRICHTHYRALTAEIRPIAEKYGVTYKANNTIFDAIKEHYLHLRNLGLQKD